MATTNINNNGDELATKLVLPEDIIFQILLWLPVVSLLRFKSVCKSWYSLIKSSRFILQHNNKGTQEDEENYNNHNLLILQSHPSGLECKLISSSSHDGGSGDGVDDNNTIYQASENLDIPEFLSIYNFSELRDAKMISCKGIICFLHYNWNVSLWNPATKQFRVLPESQIPLPGKGKGFKVKIGFGFDAETNDYKVVRFLYSIQNFHADDCRYCDHVEVYSLSTNSWKTLDIGFSITHVEKDSEPKMPFRNGEIYCWVGAVDWHRFCLLTFNFRTEVFDTIPLPDDPTFRLYRAPRLDILKEKVVILLNVEGDTTALPYNFNYQIWVMNEYGVKDSWSKVYTVGPFSFISKSIGFAMNGNLLLSVMDEERYQQLCLCDLVTQQITKLPGQDSRLNIGAAVYKECLCSV